MKAISFFAITFFSSILFAMEEAEKAKAKVFEEIVSAIETGNKQRFNDLKEQNSVVFMNSQVKLKSKLQEIIAEKSKNFENVHVKKLQHLESYQLNALLGFSCALYGVVNKWFAFCTANDEMCDVLNSFYFLGGVSGIADSLKALTTYKEIREVKDKFLSPYNSMLQQIETN